MADSENIGGIDISIGADYSQLLADFDSMETAATAAGADVADAFTGAAEGVTNFDDAIAGAVDSASGLGDSAGTAAGQLGDLTDSVSGAGDAADGAAGSFDGAGDAAAGAGDAASGAAGGFDDLTESESEAGEGAEGAGGQLAEMAEQMAAVGEALVITEGLTELGSEALGAADSITTASIALTNITGSADGAQETIEGLEQLGMSDGLAMPSLLTAATRMSAMVPAGTDVDAELALVANGAATMGTSIESATQRFDQMVTAGTASARTLTQLGLSLPSLAAAFDEVTGSSAATSTNVAAMFKSLDDQGRIAVLNAALSTLGNTAEQVAQQTFGGQWQQLANAWEAVMVQVGQALLPTISDLISLTKTDIVPFINGAISAFNSLPGPIKDNAVALALVAAAIIPITGAIGAFGLALSGLETFLPAVNGLLTTLGITSAGTAGAEGIAATASVGMGGAAAEAVPEIAAQAEATEAAGGAATEAAYQYDLFVTSAISADWSAQAEQLELFAGAETAVGEAATGALAVTGGLVVVITAAAVAIGQLTAALLASHNLQQQDIADHTEQMNTIRSLEQAFVSEGGNINVVTAYMQANNMATMDNADANSKLIAFLQQEIGTLENAETAQLNAGNSAVILSGALKTLTTNVQTQDTAFQNAVGVYNAVTASLATGAPLYGKAAANTADLTNAMEALVAAAGKTPEGMGNATVAIVADQLAAEKASLGYQAAAGAYQTLLSAFNSGGATQAQVTTAFNKMEAAENAAAAAGVPIPGSLKAIDEAAAGVVNSMTDLASSAQLATDQTIAQSDNLTALSAAAIVADQKLDLLRQEQDTLKTSVANGTAQQSQLNTVLGEVATAATAAQNATFKLQSAQLAQGNAAADAGGQIGLMQQALNEANLAEDQAKTKFDAGTISVTAYTGAQKAATTAAVNLAVAAAEQGADVSNSIAPWAQAAVAYAGAEAKYTALTAAFLAGKAALSDVAAAQTAALNAQIAMDQQNAVAAAGLSNVTTQTGLLEAAVVAAKAKVDDLTAAQTSLGNEGPQLYAAQQALIQAQKALTDAQNAGNTSAQLLASGTTNLNNVMQSVPAAATAAATGINTVGTAANTATGQVNALATAVKSATTDFSSLASAQSTGAQAINEGSLSKPGYITDVTAIPGTEPGTLQETVTFLPDAATQLATALASALALTPAKGTSAQALDEDALAQAEATLQAYNEFFNSGAGVTVAQIQNAQTAVTTAQTALNALTGATAAAASTTATTDQALLALGPALTSPIVTSTTGTTATGTTTPVASTGTAGTSAIDGGSYPAVTAHQAAGEIWAVSTNGVASAGGTTSTGSTADLTQTITDVTSSTSGSAALTTAAGAIGGATQQISTVAGGLIPINTSLATIATATQQTVSDVGGILQRLSGVGVGTTSSALPGVVSTSGISTAAGAPIATSYGSGNPQGSTVGTPSNTAPAVPGYNPGVGSAPIQVTANFQGATFGGSSAQMQAQVQAAVTAGLVQALRTAGARF